MKYFDHIAWNGNVLSTKLCEDIIEWFEDKKDHIIEERREGVHQDIISNPAKFGSFESLHKELITALKNQFDTYRKEFRWCPSNFDSMSYKIQKSYPGKGFTAWHAEDGDNTNRFLVWMIYLNQTIGGQTQFYNQRKHFKPEPGLCLIWPSGWTHTHRSMPNLRSNKYIMTGWWHYA